jgi:hypothetical protein
LFFLNESCTSQKVKPLNSANYNYNFDSCQALIKSGDLIVRLGNDDISQLFANLNTRNKNYSHCGVAIVTDSSINVYHIIGGVYNQEGLLRVERLVDFINPKNNARWGIVRFVLDSVERNLFCGKICEYYKRGIAFDNKFDLMSDNKMYCSELVYKSLVFASKDSSIVRPTIAYNGKPYIAIDDLLGNKWSQTICEVVYK